ncbi:hypothetical protein D3C72_2266580 [compost metagenome]
MPRLQADAAFLAGAAWLPQQADAHPHQVRRAQVLHRVEHQRVGLEQGGHAGHCQPHQDLVAEQQPEQHRGHQVFRREHHDSNW